MGYISAFTYNRQSNMSLFNNHEEKKKHIIMGNQSFFSILLICFREKGILMTSREMKDIMKNAGNDSV